MGAEFMYEMLPMAVISPERRYVVRGIIEDLDEIHLCDSEYTIYLDGSTICRDNIYNDFDRYCKFDNDREVNVIDVNENIYYYISGGMSWGDDPTEACRVMYRLKQIKPLYDVLERFAKEDRVRCKLENKPNKILVV